MGLALLRCLAAVVLVAACGLWPSGISRDQAIEIASEHAGLRDPVFVAADVKDASAIEWHGPAPVGRLWVIRFRGIASACGPAPAPGNPPNPCFEMAAESTVYLEYATGEFVSAGTGPVP